MTELLRKNILFLRVLSFCQFTATQFQKRYWELGTHKGAHLRSRLIEEYLLLNISSAEDLPREFQLFFGRKLFVKRFDICILHIVTLRRLIYTGNIVKITRG